MGKISNYNIADLNKICELKVDDAKAYSQSTALIIFVYDSENIHRQYQLLVWRDQTVHSLYYRIFIDNKLENLMRSIGELKLVVGDTLEVEIDDINIKDSLLEDEKNGIISNEKAMQLHLHDEEINKIIEDAKKKYEEYEANQKVTEMINEEAPSSPMSDMSNMMGGGMGMLGALFGGMGGMMPPMGMENNEDVIDAEVKPAEDNNEEEKKEE